MTNAEIKKQLTKAEQQADKDKSRDLFLIIANDGNIYRQTIKPTIVNLRRKMSKGNFDGVQSVQAFYNIVLSALKNPMFNRYYAYSIKSVDVPTRYSTAVQLLEYFTDEIDKISKIDKGDWIDLRSAQTVELKAGEFKLIPLGVAMQLPEGYEAHVVPRSSTYKNFGIIQTNHQAVIDESYCGDNDQWFYPAYALRDTVININERICQFRIMKKQPVINFEEVEILGNDDRGGIGSTGVN